METARKNLSVEIKSNNKMNKSKKINNENIWQENQELLVLELANKKKCFYFRWLILMGQKFFPKKIELKAIRTTWRKMSQKVIGKKVTMSYKWKEQKSNNESQMERANIHLLF